MTQHHESAYRQLRVAASILMLTPTIIAAQQLPAFEAASSLSSGSGANCSSALSTSMSASYRGLSASLLPTLVTSVNQSLVSRPAASVRWQSPEYNSWRLAAEGAVGSSNADCTQLSSVSRGYVQVSRVFSKGGVALSYASKSLSSLDPALDREGLTASAWAELGPAVVSIDVRSHVAGVMGFLQTSTRPVSTMIDSVVGGDTLKLPRPSLAYDTTHVESERKALDLRARLHWARGRFQFAFIAGGTAGRVPFSSTPPMRTDTLPRVQDAASMSTAFVVRGWARGDVRFNLTSLIDLTGGIAALPEQPFIGAPPRRVAMLGFTLNGLPRSSDNNTGTAKSKTALLESVRHDSTRVTVRLHLPSAKTVELSGEATSWTPVLMRRTRNGWWEADLTALPGSYRMNVRVDGRGWNAPPGTVPTRDEFGGEVGVIQLR